MIPWRSILKQLIVSRIINRHHREKKHIHREFVAMQIETEYFDKRERKLEDIMS